MSDIDMIFLSQQYQEKIDLSFLEGADKKKKEQEDDQNE